ncbi:MAG: hypothetical protein FIB06_03965 [Betaproteobacteria bacterium]|nr:hypothetical protein [Betaproteobacteria bacterium]
MRPEEDLDARRQLAVAAEQSVQRCTLARRGAQHIADRLAAHQNVLAPAGQRAERGGQMHRYHGVLAKHVDSPCGQMYM